jgi:hypothetical protein
MFRRRSAHFLDPDAEAWQIECWLWLLTHRGSREAFRETRLVTPTAEFFPALGDLQGHDRACAILSGVQKLCGLQDWPVQLTLQRDTSDMAGGVLIQDHAPCAGTFRFEQDGQASISYDPALLSRPASLIATFAHELGHYYHADFEELPPGGEALIEPATDVTAAYFGFGIFCANACFEHEDDGQFYRVGKSGYLTESEWIFSLAIFLILRDMTPDDASPHLKPHLRKQLAKAFNCLKNSSLTDPLQKALI